MERHRRSIRSAFLKLLFAGVAIFIVFNVIRANNDDERPRFEVPDTSNQIRLSDPVSASHYIEVGGEPFILVMSKHDNERIETADLRIISVDPRDDLDQAGWLHTSMSVQRPVEALTYANGHVYVGKTREGTDRPALWVVDLSDPAGPYEANLLNARLPIRTLAASGDGYMVAAGFDGDFLIYDISQPTEPAVIGSLSEDLVISPDLSIQGSTLFLDHLAGVILYDMSDPGNPARISEIEHPDWSRDSSVPEPDTFLLGDEGFDENLPGDSYLDFDVQGGLFALASGKSGVELYSFRHGESPYQVGTVETGDRVASVALDGDRLYALGARPADGDRVRFAIHTFGIADPAEPQALESTDVIAGLPRYQDIIARDGNVWIVVNSTIYQHRSAGR